jgi:DNA-binding transcriptional MerR regulator
MNVENDIQKKDKINLNRVVFFINCKIITIFGINLIKQVPTIDIQHLSKLYYSIGELSNLFGVNASLLRFWEKEFQFVISKKNAKGNRLYSIKEIEKINRIYLLVKIEGYTIEGAKKALKSKDSLSENNLNPQESNNSALILKLESIKKRLNLLK